MTIQWFPGHMTKAVRMMEENISLCDCVIYVLDARAPFACLNTKLDSLFEKKPVLYAINKADLVSEKEIKQTVDYFKNKGNRAVSINGTISANCKKLLETLKQLLEENQNRFIKKGINKSPRVMVAGIPNSGKSTIINSLCGQKRTSVGDKAGVTRGKQWVKIQGLDLLDTPGTMQPRLDNQNYARQLAVIGSINDDILDIETLCFEFLKFLVEKHSYNLISKYKLESTEGETLEVFDNICKSRGFVNRGGEYDYSRGARAIIDDYRKGRLGRFAISDFCVSAKK